MKIRDRLLKFMYNRYGPDDLYKFTFYLYFIIFVINIFLGLRILSYIELLLIIIITYRFFSKNKTKRSRENKFYLKIKNKIFKYIKSVKRKFKNDDYIYKKCNSCKKILRLPIPNKRGIRHVKCPNCKKRLTVLCLKKLKVKVIRKEKNK